MLFVYLVHVIVQLMFTSVFLLFSKMQCVIFDASDSVCVCVCVWRVCVWGGRVFKEMYNITMN